MAYANAVAHNLAAIRAARRAAAPIRAQIQAQQPPERYFDPEIMDWVEVDPQIPEDFDTTFFLPLWEVMDIEDIYPR